MNMKRPVYPVWYDGKRINETVFCREFLKDYPMKCVNDTFFTVLGPVNDERKLRKAIFEKISPYVSTGLNRQVTNIMDVLRLECASAELPVQTDRIHVANGTLHLMGTFTREMEYCRNRLPVAYNSNAPVPERWLAFLHELLEDEDIMTLQEFMGYCLIPSNKGQKMLLITGKGGEGKSRIGIVLRSLLGANMNTGSIAKVESDRFARADLEHKLLMLDDDVKMESLPQASTLKAIITAELPMDLEKKGKQSYQGLLYSRFLVLGNGTIKAQNDTSYGFFRRQIILTVKERDPWRKDDPFLAERLIAEKEGILLWCIEGLRRLMAHDFAFTVSAKAEENVQLAESESNNARDFLVSEGYIKLDPDAQISSQQFYEAYAEWCRDNALDPLTRRMFGVYVKENASLIGLNYTNHIDIGGGRMVRGYTGIGLVR